MNFDFNDEQREIKSTAHDFLGSRFKPEKVRELAESDNPYDDDLWGQICELGWPGIAIAEEYGGRELDYVTYGLIVEEIGRNDSAMRTVVSVQTSLVCSAIWSEEAGGAASRPTAF